MDIVITQAKKTDRKELENFFTLVITDTFKNDDNRSNDVEHHIKYQLALVDSYLKHDGKVTYYSLAKTKNTIVGTIALLKPNELISRNLTINLENVPEIGGVYVLPLYQNKGIGTLLFKSIIQYLQNENITVFVLDSTFKKAQSFWIKKLGKPKVTLKDYWAKGKHHMIWYCSVKNLCNK